MAIYFRNPKSNRNENLEIVLSVYNQPDYDGFSVAEATLEGKVNPFSDINISQPNRITNL